MFGTNMANTQKPAGVKRDINSKFVVVGEEEKLERNKQNLKEGVCFNLCKFLT